MEATLKVLNELVESGVVERYAIGGAVGAIFWVGPLPVVLPAALRTGQVVAVGG